MNRRFNKWKKPTIRHGVSTRWHWVVWYPKKLTLGKNTDIGAFTCIFAHHGVEIGDNVQIGSHCAIYSLNTIENKKGKVTIGKNVRIGAHSTIMQGVTIGEGALIGAHSFVNKNIPARSTAFGVPARVVKRSAKKL